MADYAKMYKRLFNSVTQAIEILQAAQQETEEMYMESPEPEIRLPPDSGVPGKDGGEPDKPGHNAVGQPSVTSSLGSQGGESTEWPTDKPSFHPGNWMR